MKSQSLPVPPGKVKQFRCAFFNFSAEGSNQTGGWSYSGVETEVINNTHAHCNSAHLTSFVVLVSIVDSVGEEPVSVDCSVHSNRHLYLPEDIIVVLKTSLYEHCTLHSLL